MNFDILIPQIWYDFIGRIIPGTYILSYCYLAINKHLGQEILKPSFFMVFIALVFSYLVGALIGGLWYYFEKELRRLIKDDLSKFEETSEQELMNAGVQTTEVIKILTQDKKQMIPFIYDLIQVKLPKMGARISKLRAEQLLCGALFISFIPLCILSKIIFIGDFHLISFLDIALPIIALIIAVLAFFLYIHLKGRYNKAMIDGWLLAQTEIKEN
jgi:hypothetical protein